MTRQSEAPFVMEVEPDHVLKQSEILAIRALTDSVSRMGALIDQLAQKADRTNDAVIRFESYVAALTKLEERVDRIDSRTLLLEADRNQRSGRASVAEWLAKHMPWLLALALAVGGSFAVKGNIR